MSVSQVTLGVNGKGFPKLPRVSVVNSREGFQHYLDPASQEVLQGIGAASVAAFGSKLRLKTSNDGRNTVPVVSSHAFGQVLRAPASRLGRNSHELARKVVLGECVDIPTEPISVKLGKLIVPKPVQGRPRVLLATVTDPTGRLVAEYEEITNAMQELEGVSDLGMPALHPHVTIGTISRMRAKQIPARTEALSAQFAGTELTLLPLEQE